MAKKQSNLKRTVSTILSFTTMFASLQIPVLASDDAIYLQQEELSEQILTSGEFYLGTPTAQIQENSDFPYLLKIGRGGDYLPEADVRLNMIDITAKYGDDYKIKIHNSSVFGEKVKNSFSSTSLLEQIIENKDEIVEENYTDGIVSNPGLNAEEMGKLYEEDVELLDAYLTEDVEGYKEEKVALIESVVSEENVQEESEPNPNSLKDAKELATGLESDRTPMNGGSNSLENYTEQMLKEMSLELESAYLTLGFEEGETEKYVEIIPKNNDVGDGDRMFSVNLFAVSENAVVGEKSGMSVIITDDEVQEEAVVSFSEAEYYPEDGFIKAIIRRSGAINQLVCVNVKTEDVTAVNGRDYSQVDTSVMFPYGITERKINIPIRSDYVEGSAEFKIVISDAVSCNIGEMSTAYGIISEQSESFTLFAETENAVNEDSGSSEEATTSSYLTGEGFDIASTFSAWISSNAQSASYITPTDDEVVEMYTKSNVSGAFSQATWNMGERYDISGLAIDWTKESGKPCYTETFVFAKTGGRDENLWDSSTERWERRTTDIYFPFDKASEYFVKQTRSGGFLGKSPTLMIHSIKPIMRPFEITLKGAEPIKFLNENGEYVDNTTMSEVADANNALLQNATDTGTGTVVKFSGSSFTVTSNSKYSYISGLKIVNEETGDSKIIRDNLAPGTKSVSVKLENDFIKDNIDYITFYKNGSLGRKGTFSVQPIMGRYETTVRIHDDYRGRIGYNGNPEVKENADGLTLTYHKGDQICFSQILNEEYSSSYTGSRIRIVTKENSTAEPDDSMLAYVKNKNYCMLRSVFSDIDVYPNFDKKDNHIIVRVAKADLEKFNTEMGIFKMPSVENGDYIEYTVVDSDVFASGVYYEFVARAKENGYTPVWNKVNTDVKYSQGTFYFEGTKEIEENIIYLTCLKADDMGYSLTGNAYYSNVALRDGTEGLAWMPASGVYVLVGSERYAISNEDGKFSTTGMSGINGMNVIYKIVASGRTEYKTTTLSNAKISEVGTADSVIEVYDVNVGTIKAATSDISSPYVSSAVATNKEGVERGYISINDETTDFFITIANNGAKYTDTDGVERTENVTAVDLLVYDGNSHQLKTEITGAREISNANGISFWNFSTVFKKGESEDYAASDELYIRITTDKVIGNGKGYNAEGEFVELDSLKQTIHAPLNTGYTFVESNRINTVKQSIVFDTDINFISLPILGSMVATFNVKNFTFNIDSLPNGGQRLSVGYVVKETPSAKTDNGREYSITELKKLVEDIKNGGNKAKDKSKLGSNKWGLAPVYGIFLDYGVKNVYYTDNVSQKFVFIGGGLYIGITGNFRVVHYFIVGGVPCYVGADGEFTFAVDAGLSALNEDTATADSILTKEKALEEDYATTAIIRANAIVKGYTGVGLCGTLGVRVGLLFNANYIYYPTIVESYPDYNPNGLVLSAAIKAWVDVFLFTMPLPNFVSTGAKYGYYKDVDDSEKAELQLMSCAPEQQQVVMKTRNSDNFEWLPEDGDVSLFSTFEEDTSTVLLENGYDRADSQLLDMGDGRIMLAFIADDTKRSDEERTALMYSIYEDGVWSEPVIVQDDGTADFEPDICDAGDKVHITWTSREADSSYSSETEFLKSLEVYSTTLDKSTLEIGEIERLTEDEFYDSAPNGVYDEKTGDYIVYYLKADVSEDFVKSVSPITNESVIVYMLYDAKEGRWARDYYYDNEVASQEAEDYLVAYWGGQRFLSSPIKDFGVNDPIIIDFDSISYNGLGVYTFTIDEDNNLDTESDRELFVQVYDFEDHATYVPIRITHDNISDARPQLVRNGDNTYLFWLQNGKDVRYIDLSELIREGVDDDGTIKDDYELSYGVVFYSPSNNLDVTPNFSSYNAFVDKDNNLFITWLQAGDEQSESSSQEIYASALIRTGYENVSWSEGVRLTNSGVLNDEVAFVTDANGDLMTVSNQYTMNMTDESVGVDNIKLVATKFKTVGSMDVDNVEFSNDAPQEGSEITVTAKIKNTGLKPAKGYTLKVYESVNKTVGNELYTVVAENEIAPSASEYVTFNWTMPENYEGIEDLSLHMEIQEAETEQIHTYSSQSIEIKPVYNILECSVEEREGGFYATYTIRNEGNADANADDKVVINFNDVYNKNIESEPYLEEPIGELKINEFKTWVMPIEIEEKQLEFGYVNAYIEVIDNKGESLGECKTFMITSDKPHNVIINGDENLSQITLIQGESVELIAEAYRYADMKFSVADESVATIEDGKLVAGQGGETELLLTAVPYGVCKTLKVVVEKDDSDVYARIDGISVGQTPITDLSRVKTGDKLTVAVDYVNTTDEDKTLSLAVACYDSKNALLGCVLAQKDMDKSITEDEFTIESGELDMTDVVKMKVMIFDGLGSIRPLSPCAIFE